MQAALLVSGRSVLLKTPAEDFSEQLPDISNRFDDYLKTAILSNHKIKLYNNVYVNGTKREDVVAVNFWNLKFAFSSSAGADIERMFCEKTFDDKPPVVRDDALFESLDRIGMKVDNNTYQTALKTL